MKGMMFTEFVEWVETSWSPATADDMLDAVPLASGGAYTAVGTYDHEELVSLVSTLSQQIGTPVPDLIRRFGRSLFAVLARSHPAVMTDVDSSFAVLERLDDHIHPEVRKLYPEAEVPTFEAQADEADLLLTYRSARPFADLAEGLILGCGDWFGETLVLTRSNGPVTTTFRVRRER